MRLFEGCCCHRSSRRLDWGLQEKSSSRRSGGRKRKDECGGRGGGAGQARCRWAGGQHLLPSTLSELREGGFGLVSCLPSGEGGCGYSPGRFWTTVRASSLPATSRSTRLALSCRVCPLILGIATPALVEAVTGCNTTPAQADTERPFCTSVCFRLLPGTARRNTDCLGKRGMCGATMSC